MTRYRSTARPGDSSQFEQDIKLIMPGRGGEIEAAVDTESLYALGTCNIILNKPQSPVNLWVLAAILNSNFINIWYKALFPSATVTMNEIRLVPLPFGTKSDALGSKDVINDLDRLARERSRLNHKNIQEYTNIDAEIDKLVDRLYSSQLD